MCRDFIEIQSRRAALRFHEEMKQNMPLQAAGEGLISCACRPRGCQAAPAGLAVVAALEAELVQSAPRSTASPPIPISSSSSSSACEDDNYTRYDFPAYCHKQRDFNHAVKNQNSIFSTSLSPPCGTYNYIMSCNSHGELSCDDFLGACFSCKRPLAPGKDIYMYRGDQAFCSTECRYKHIVADESLPCTIQINQQCDQASYPTKKHAPITIAILV